VAPERSLPELTLLAVVLGCVLSVVMGAANTYLGLKVGMTVSASIPAAVISMALLRGLLRRESILENNIVQTMASSGESLAAGVIFTIPALVLVGAWQDFRFWPTTLIAGLGGLLGIVFMVPMRRALIVDRPDLVFPEGVACSEVLIAGEQGGAGIRPIALGLGLGAVFKLLETGFSAIQATVEGAIARGRSVLYFGSDLSVALLAVGYIVDLNIAVLVFLGGAIGWLIAMPLLGGYTNGVPLDYAWDLWSDKVRYIGVGTMLVGGVYSIWSVRRGIVAGVSGLRSMGDDGKATLRTEQNLPLWSLMTVFLVSSFATFLLYDFLIGSLGLAAITAILMIVTAFLFVAVATYIAGLVGSSNSPVSGMTICALLIAAGVLLALGIRGDSAILATLGIAGVVCCATCTSGDVAQDLKTGLLVGATPSKQQLAQIIGTVVAAFFFAPILTILHKAYTIGEGLAAPQAGLFASLTEGFFGDGELPFDMIGIGAAIGVALLIVNALLERTETTFRAHVMPVAVGIYLPFSVAPPLLLGGLIRHWVSRSRGNASESHDRGVLLGSGLIAGEALMGIGLGALIAAEIALPEWANHPATSVLAFLLVAGVLWTVARRRPA
jgi:putative OPT family oligopeptide transporter